MASSSKSRRNKETNGATGSGEANNGEIGCNNGEVTSENPTSGDHQNGGQAGTKNREGTTVSEASDESLNVALLPPRLFSIDRYPAKGRINSYSRPEYLLDLVEVLDGTPEFGWLKASCFGGLFELPIRKSSLSGKLVHQIICRSLVTRKRNEIWFVFGGHPIRFSLREFAIITGLNCGPFPSKEVIAKMQAFEEDEEGEVVKYYYNTLIGPKNSYTIQEIVNMLKLDKRQAAKDKMTGDRRIRLALIGIVEGILVCNSSSVKATKKVAEMVKDLDEFVRYPWGRKSFSRTLEMVKVGKEVDNEAKLAEKLTQSHTATHGFTLAFQLLALHAIPQLEAYLPDLNNEQTFTDRSVLQLTLLKKFHNSNILETEMDPKNILRSEEEMEGEDFSWDNEEEDERVDYMLNKLKEGHIFKKDDWQGGVSHLPLITTYSAKAEKPKKRTAAKPSKKKKGSVKITAKRKQKEHSEADHSGDTIDGIKAEELLREVDRRINEHTFKVQQMLSTDRSINEDEVVDKVLRILKEKGVYHSRESEDINSEEVCL